MSLSMYGTPPKHGEHDTPVDWARALAPLGPGRLRVIIDISNKCNLRCQMCHFSFDHVFHQPAHHMRPETFERIAASVLPHAHTVVLSAANEPLMSPWFTEILRLVAPYKIPAFYFLTNAQLLTEKISEAIIETGVTQVQISADGATKETYERIRRGARFETLLRNIQYLTNRKQELRRSAPQLQFNIVLMKSNVEELERYVDLAEQLGVEWIAARHLVQVTGLGMEHESLTHDRPRANLYFRRFLKRAEESKTVKVVSFPDLFNGERLDAIDRRTPSPMTSILDPVCAEAAPSSPQVLPAAAKSRRSLTMKIVREIRRIPRNVLRHLRAPAGREENRKRPRRDPLLPRGAVDFPKDPRLRVNNAVELQGWASDQEQLRRVLIEREPLASDPPETINERGCVHIGEATILSGERPNPPGTFQRFPHRVRLGWEFQLRREMASKADSFETVIQVVAENVHGRCAVIGQRSFTFAYDASAAPYLFCSKPFENVVIDSRANVNPYPDCRVPAPYGSLASPEASFAEVWHGPAFTELRRRIIERDPPEMCLTCANFINRNVDDPAYFLPR
jgi:MoaA/NifB/PqqE/SkfB family radical SAM enzyme